MPKDQAFENALAQFNRVADAIKIDAGVKKILQSPERLIETTVVIKDDKDEIQTFPAYRSQYCSALGPTKGGIRFHPQVSRNEVKALSMWMTWKCSLLGLPLGGGKGGIAVDPKQLSKRELEQLSRNYIRGLYKYLGPTQDVPAPDVNTNGQIMAWMLDEYNALTGGQFPGMITGKPVAAGGSLGRDKATSLGAFIVFKELIKAEPKYKDLRTVLVSGKGNAGSNFIRFLQEDDIDWKVVGVSDSSGGVYNLNGIDLDKLLSHIESGHRYADIANELGTKIENSELCKMPADIFVPAGLEGEVTIDNAHDVKAKLIVEIANGPITADAEKILDKIDVLVIPDILANAGGVTVSYFEQVQGNANYFWSLEEVNSKLEVFMKKAFNDVYARMHKKIAGLSTTRDYAYLIAIERVAEAILARR
ncbi:MAG: Glu/Leu/Phe/Val dehydrogenase [Patescibacteria group bacterium]|nr:Glu/Leu/Phe/Val dehydrogenase [Patescibacteria group bacterium]